MFKRVQKRQRKQEKEEELGLDSELKEVLGLQDTDSEESDSSSDEGSSDSEDEDEDADGAESAGEDAEQVPDEEDEEGSEASDEEDEFPPMSVTEAVSDPLYLVSMDPEIRACILCPGKHLKNPRMADVHKSSKAHSRRFTRFVELVSQAGPDGDVRDLIRTINDEARTAPSSNTAEGTPSKRAEKRKAKMAALKARREKHKEIAARKRKQAEKAKASGEATKSSPNKPSSEPPKKKRKVVAGEASGPEGKPNDKPVKPESDPAPAKPRVQKKAVDKSEDTGHSEEPSVVSVSKPASKGDETTIASTKSKKSKAVESAGKPHPPTTATKLKKARHKKAAA